MNFLRLGATVVVMEHFDAAEALALIERHQATHSQWVPTMFVRMLKLPEEVRTRPRRVSSHEARRPRRRPLPDPGQGADDRVVGAGHPRVLRGHRGQRLLLLQQRGVAGPQGHGRPGADRAGAHPRRGGPGGARRRGGHHLLRGHRRRADLRVPQRPGQDRGQLPGRRVQHARRHRQARRRRLPLPHRPQGQHDHLRRGEHLPAGDRERPDRAPRRWPTPR